MTRKQLRNKIFKLHKGLYPLNISSVKADYPELLEAAYSFKPFLGWRQALEDAGLNYEIIEIHFGERVECPYCGGCYKALPTHLKVHELDTEGFLEEFPGADLVSEESRVRRMIPHPEMAHWESWSWEYVLDRAWQWNLRLDDFNQLAVRESDNSLVSRVNEMGSHWSDVRQALGLPPEERGMTQEQVIEALKERSRKGLSLKQYEASEQQYLKSGAYLHFGSWRKALAAAGLQETRQEEGDAQRYNPTYKNKTAVITALKTRARKGQPINSSGVQEDNCALRGAVYDYFGTWVEGIKAAGLLKVMKHQKQSRKVQRIKYGTKVSLQEALRARFAAGKSLKTNLVQQDDWALYRRALDHFGSWEDALLPIGLLEHYYEENPWAEPPKYPDRESILKAIRLRHKKGKSLLFGDVKAEDSKLTGACYRMFTGWKEAKNLALKGM